MRAPHCGAFAPNVRIARPRCLVLYQGNKALGGTTGDGTNMKPAKLIVGIAIVALISAYFAFDLGRCEPPSTLKSQQADRGVSLGQPLLAGIFFSHHVAVTRCRCPAPPS